MSKTLSLISKGIAMGIAEVIPGVSGGTIAFITGIYETLIETITKFNASNLQLLLQGKWADFWNSVNGPFLIRLIFGMVLGIAIGITVVSFLLENFPEPLFGFFLGLILSSALFIFRKLEVVNPTILFMTVVAFVLSFLFAGSSSLVDQSNLFYIFIGGILAISAFLLPGISGSLVLLILGMYSTIILGIKNFVTTLDPDLGLMLLVFGVGMVIGLLSMSRFLTFLFRKYPNSTYAVLVGLLLGSARKLWPWKNPTWVMDKTDFHQYAPDLNSLIYSDFNGFKILKESLVVPSDYFGNTWTVLTVICFVVGFIIVFLFDAVPEKEELYS